MAKITSIPSQHPTKVVDFQRLDGGLNIWELDYRLANNQSPEMKNMWWQDGVLQCRDGQEFMVSESKGVGYTAYSELFWDNAFCHIGDKLYRIEVEAEEPEYVELVSGVPENRGTFYRYDENLYYKNRGGFYRIDYQSAHEDKFVVTEVAKDAYVPTTLLNANYSTGSGDMYQPENRLSAKKRVKYNAAETTEVVTATGDGSKKTFSLGKTSADQLTGVDLAYWGNTLISATLYTVDTAAGTITFNNAPEKDVVVTVSIKIGVTSYKLPVSEVDGVLEVKVDGKILEANTDYAVDLEEGRVLFVKAPPVTNPATNNTVEILYEKENPEAKAAIMSCRYATVYGGENNVCMVLGGCEAQPNAFFWNSNDSVSFNDSYWPILFYNLASDAEDEVTGFGKQYGSLIIFKERSVGRASYGIETVEERDLISLTYTEINNRIGCDLPWTIQLIENNLVFCNTTGGVHMIRDSSAALENNIVCISRNVNGTDQRAALIYETKYADRDSVVSFDDDNRYWLNVNGHVYVWDYVLSSHTDPSWFYFTNIYAQAYIYTVSRSYHLDAKGRFTKLLRSFSDYTDENGEAIGIEKVYQFPPQYFGTYDVLKDIQHVIFVLRADTDSVVDIEYQSDYETRHDNTGVQSRSWQLAPRNLEYRSLEVQKFSHVARRKPGCRHVRHFSMRLSNNSARQDMAIIAAQIYFRYLGRDR